LIGNYPVSYLYSFWFIKWVRFRNAHIPQEQINKAIFRNPLKF
jgi:hypothetical protein